MRAEEIEKTRGNKEMNSREPCPLCEGTKRLPTEEGKAAYSIEVDSVLTVSDEGFRKEYSFFIQYCPMCGRKLNDFHWLDDM